MLEKKVLFDYGNSREILTSKDFLRVFLNLSRVGRFEGVDFRNIEFFVHVGDEVDPTNFEFRVSPSGDYSRVAETDEAKFISDALKEIKLYRFINLDDELPELYRKFGFYRPHQNLDLSCGKKHIIVMGGEPVLEIRDESPEGSTRYPKPLIFRPCSDSYEDERRPVLSSIPNWEGIPHSTELKLSYEDDRAGLFIKMYDQMVEKYKEMGFKVLEPES